MFTREPRKPTGARTEVVPKLEAPPPSVQTDEASKAHSILQYAHDSATSLIAEFCASIQARAQERRTAAGAPTDEQMDLLRAMLVFAGAGIDAMLKQLIRDALSTLSSEDTNVRAKLEEFAEARIRASLDRAEPTSGSKFLASLLADENPRERLVEAYVQNLTGGSLQSIAELSRSLAALGLLPDPIVSAEPRLREAFLVRNKIVHELDINFEHPKRNRQTRPMDEMVELTNAILRVARAALIAVDERVAALRGA
jgi:hypothetical protein